MISEGRKQQEEMRQRGDLNRGRGGHSDAKIEKKEKERKLQHQSGGGGGVGGRRT